MFTVFEHFKFCFSILFNSILFYSISLNALVCFDIILCLAYIINLINKPCFLMSLLLIKAVFISKIQKQTNKKKNSDIVKY